MTQEGPSALEEHLPLVLLSGIPATGKSTFGRWLEENYGFAHIDLESSGLDRFGLSPTWQRICRLPPPDVTPFISALQALACPVALDWGFPPPWLPLVEALHHAGVTAWWFDGDRAAARTAFIHRGTVPVSALEQQMRGIEANQSALDAFYQTRTVRAIEVDGSLTPADWLFTTIFGELPLRVVSSGSASGGPLPD